VANFELITSEIFNAVTQLRHLTTSSYLASPQEIQTQFRSYVDRMANLAHREGIGTEDLQAVAYAVCALADEVVLSTAGPLREHWISQPLQLSYFNEHLAGENFFRYLDGLRRDVRKAPVVRVYYTCLLFGFKGKYSVRGAEVALSDYTDALRRELSQTFPAPQLLSPDGQRPQELLIRVARGLPVVWMAAGIAVLALSFYAGMHIVIDQAVTDLVGFLHQFSRG
jgi:type VI secretion system protein ImpK